MSMSYIMERGICRRIKGEEFHQRQRREVNGKNAERIWMISMKTILVN